MKRRRSMKVLCWALLLLLLLAIRWGSFRISTNAMEETLHKGDFVLVNHFLERTKIMHNDIVLFKTTPAKEFWRGPYMISRCVGMPGDTIFFTNEGYLIRGEKFPDHSIKEHVYVIEKEIKQALLKTLEQLDIPYRTIAEDQETLSLRLTQKEQQQVSRLLPSFIEINPLPEKAWSHAFVIPAKGRPYRLDTISLKIGEKILLAECEKKGLIREQTLYFEGKEMPFFFFQQDYYWVLSDNPAGAVDSRHLGVIPASSIVGKAWFCTFSRDPQNLFKRLP